MATERIEKRIFIVGSARSGTTLLQALMATQDIFTTFKETHFFDFGVKRPLNSRVYYVSHKVHDLLDQFFKSNNVSDELKQQLFSRKPDFPFFPGLGVNSWVKYLIEVLDETALSRGKVVWLEKTPEHLRRIELIEKNTDNTYFIHLIREGPDTIASYLRASEQWGKERVSLSYAVKRWNANIRFSLQRARIGKDIFINYTVLTNSTPDVLNKIFSWLGIQLKMDRINEYKSKAMEIIDNNEKWKRNIFDEIKPRSTFQEYLNEEEKKYVLKNLDMKTYNRLISML